MANFKQQLMSLNTELAPAHGVVRLHLKDLVLQLLLALTTGKDMPIVIKVRNME